MNLTEKEVARIEKHHKEVDCKFEFDVAALADDWRSLQVENKRLREALEFYANFKSYEPHDSDVLSPVIVDDGFIASEALATKKEGEG